MSFQLDEQLQNILVDFLRYAFINNTDYPYLSNPDGTTDLDNTQIDVYRSYPKVLTSYPIIIVSSPVIPELTRTLGGDLISESWGDTGDGVRGVCFQQFGNIAELEFTIDVIGNTESERDRIASYIINAIRIIHRKYLEDRGIDVMDVSKGSTTIKPYGSGYTYSLPISVNLWAEWSTQVWNTDDILEEVALCNISIYGEIQGLSNI